MELRAAHGQAAAAPAWGSGAGPYTCIGKVLARKELALVVATIAQHWRLVPDEKLPDLPSPQTTRLPIDWNGLHDWQGRLIGTALDKGKKINDFL